MCEAGNRVPGPPPRNTRYGEFWFGRMLSVLAVLGVIGGSVAALAWAKVTGSDAVKLLTEGFWVLLAVALIYNGRAAIHDRLADVIRSIRGR